MRQSDTAARFTHRHSWGKPYLVLLPADMRPHHPPILISKRDKRQFMEVVVVKQIILNYLFIFVLPLISGGCVRFFCRKWSKAWLVTVVPALLTIAAYVAACNPPVLGSELYGLRTVQLCCFTIASLIVGLIFRKKKK